MLSNKKLLLIVVFVMIFGFVAIVFLANNRDKKVDDLLTDVNITVPDKVDTEGMAKDVPVSDSTDPEQVLNELDSIFVKVEATPDLDDLDQ